MGLVSAGGRELEIERIAGRPPAIVLLHEGLGSVSMWKEFPGALATVTGHEVLVYSRYGHGRSEPLREPRTMRYMHDEALIVLPELLNALDVERPILVGHSDGASIALIHAGGSARPVTGLVLLAPHVFVEPLSVASIAAAKREYELGGLRERLARYHVDVDSVFRGWNDIWLRPDFRDWNIEEYLPHIRCPVLVIQGEDDKYGTIEHVRRIERGVRDATAIVLPECGHAPHRDHPERIIAEIERFLDRVARRAGEPGAAGPQRRIDRNHE